MSQDKKGRPKKYTVRKGTTIDVGVISGAKAFKRASLAKKGIASIEGRILDEKG